MKTTLLIMGLAAITGCGKGAESTYDGCERDHTWRDALDVSGGSASVVVTTGCDYDLEVTRAEINGVSFVADLPDVGDIISQTEWVIDISFDDSNIELPGEYSAVLYIEAEGLREDSAPKELFAIVE